MILSGFTRMDFTVYSLSLFFLSIRCCSKLGNPGTNIRGFLSAVSNPAIVLEYIKPLPVLGLSSQDETKDMSPLSPWGIVLQACHILISPFFSILIMNWALKVSRHWK